MRSEDVTVSKSTPPELPETLRQAVREAEETGRRAEEIAHLNMPFRARLKARDHVRPQSTLAILSGIDVREEVREVRRRRPVAPAVAQVPVPSAGRALPGGSGSGRLPPPDSQKPANRFGDASQFAFAGLAVLGLAGLSVIAAENALRGSGEADPDPGAEDSIDLAGSAAATAIPAEASAPANSPPVPWFDYRSVAEALKARIAAYEAEQRAAELAAAEESQRLAAAAIAEAEANRLREMTLADAAAASAAAAERERVSSEEAARIAQTEAQRLAEAQAAEAARRAEAERLARIEAEREAAALAERQRAEAEAARLAAEAEARRQAELAARQAAAEAEARRLAQIEADRLAAEAARKAQADLAAQRAAEAEARRLAALEARRNAEAVEAARRAELEARRLAEAEAARLAAAAAPQATAASAAAPRPAAVPRTAASLKPDRPASTGLTVAAVAPVSRAAPTSMTVGNPEVRSLIPSPPAVASMSGPRLVDQFLIERTRVTATASLPAPGLDGLRNEIVRLLDSGADGSRHELVTPDNRRLVITFERTIAQEPARANVKTIDYRPLSGEGIARGFSEPASVRTTVRCRDVSYAFPGQERGRFAACEGQGGVWTLARASDPPAAPV